MAWWIIPTTADIGIVAFAPSPAALFSTAADGLQGVLISDAAESVIDSLERQSGQWTIDIGSDRPDLSLVRWLEEVLYQAEVEGRFLVDSVVAIGEGQLSAQVEWVDADLVEREVEVKAVTRHDLDLTEIPAGETVHDYAESIPDIEGPGWLCRVIFDI